jgi:hypothetical protein
MAGGALSGAAAGAAGQVTANLLTPCTSWHNGVLEAAVFGGLTGGIAGGAGYGVGQLVKRLRAQALIDDIVQNELRNVRLTHYPQYDPTMPFYKYGEAAQGLYTKVGSLAIQEGRRETLLTIAHEEMHHRLWARGWLQSEAYVESIAQRFARLKGW